MEASSLRMFLIQRLIPSHIKIFMPKLVDLLQDVVDSGANVGFLPPFNPAEGRKFWEKVAVSIRDGSCIVLAARADDEIIGTVQLDLATIPNGLHRAELAKLMVHSSQRRQGIGRILLRAVEDEARKAHRNLITVDIPKGDPAEVLYAGMGFVRFGEVPHYVRGVDGELNYTSFYYKQLRTA